MTTQPKRDRLTSAQLAIAALIVHDGLRLQKVFSMLEGELDRLNEDRGTTERARALLASTAPAPDLTPEVVVIPEPQPEPAPAAPATPVKAAQKVSAKPAAAAGLLSTREAADYLETTPGALGQNRIGNGGPAIIPFEKIGWAAYYRLADLEVEKARRAASPSHGRLAQRGVKPDPTTPPDRAGDGYSPKAAVRFLGTSIDMLAVDRKRFADAQKKGAPTQQAWRALKVPFRKIGGRVIYRKADLEAVLAGRRAELDAQPTKPAPAALPVVQRLSSRHVEGQGGQRVTKRIRKLLTVIRSMPEAQGIEVDLRQINGHLHVLAKRGEGEERRIGVMPSTPSDWRSDRNGLANLRRSFRAYAATGEVMHS